MCAFKSLCVSSFIKSAPIQGALGLFIYLPIFMANFCAFFFHKQLSQSMPHLSNIIVLISILGMLLFFSNVFVQLLLICVSSQQKSHLELLPWLVINILSILYSVVCCFVTALCTTTNVGEICAIGLPIIGLQLYLWTCVFSVYKRLEDDTNMNSREPGVSIVSHEFINSGYDYATIVEECD